MSVEILSSSDILEIGADELLEHTGESLRAASMVALGTPNGRINSLEEDRLGVNVGGFIHYVAGKHRVEDIDMIESHKAQELLVAEKRDQQSPATLHLIAEYSDGYNGSLGKVFNLNAMSRLVVAALGQIATMSEMPFQATFVSEGIDPVQVKAEGRFAAQTALSQYDEFILEAKNVDTENQSDRSALSEAIQTLSPRDGFDHSSDALVLSSDFLQGASYNGNNEVEEFDWEQGLQYYNHEMKDRLYVIRMTNIGQRILPPSRVLKGRGGRIMNLRTSEYIDNDNRVRQFAERKNTAIENALNQNRVLELDSSNEEVMQSLADFMLSPINNKQ